MSENSSNALPGGEESEPALPHAPNEQQNAPDVNTQKGSEWANYRTKELSTPEERGGEISAKEAAEAFNKE